MGEKPRGSSVFWVQHRPLLLLVGLRADQGAQAKKRQEKGS
ncbi:MAG: hypothetical protein OSJ62_13185 [Lachnospiraceae bacterium]|nr:hypothetical protein [Lachnospiraceae bacterium]